MEALHINLENQRESLFNSTISSEILDFFTFSSSNKSTCTTSFIKSSGEIKWDEVNRFLALPKEDLDQDFCSSKIDNLNEILLEISNFFESSEKDVIEGLIVEFADWTGRSNELKDAWSEKSSGDTKFAFDLLLYTSVLEFSLGNVSFFGYFVPISL